MLGIRTRVSRMEGSDETIEQLLYVVALPGVNLIKPLQL